jgi:hypothetical protein
MSEAGNERGDEERAGIYHSTSRDREVEILINV